jgi:hypothetical protein
MSTALSLDALRARIREIEGSRVVQARVPCGVPSLDRLVGGIPAPGILEIAGAPGSGRTRLALAVAAATTQRGVPVAWVDPSRGLFPPTASAHGVDLDRLLLVRPAADRESWAVEQICRSGCFPLVVVLDPPKVGKSGQKWLIAAESGRCTLVVVVEHSSRDVPACVRLTTARGRISVTRDRNGTPGSAEALPEWPREGDPWS